MRCRCCDSELSSSDLRLTQEDGSPEDFCGVCRGEVNNIDIPDHKEYMLEYEKEGVKEIFIEN